ncbi:YgcG family protein [Phenylobacterium sp. Root700]|uniref:TPM domain-containing protein n=1 Tax=Phenylobacterium sp. Root700 TaxID=1736591 RepID=UPI0006FF7684|nr:TPM domain-containing protein [Phenylobacterium sp. Root700]KRB43188.1 methanol dehydrogenase [Phenylobacterium sp. Root700]
MTRLAGPRGVFRLAVLVLLLSVGAAFAAAPKFPPLTGRVVDNANILSPQVEAELTTELATLETQTGRQLVVATLPDLQGYEIEDYGYQLLRTWGIGSKERDDGAILIVAPSERKVRIEVGYGLEPVLTDALSSVIINQRILPAFKAGNMEAGVVDGARGLIQQLSLPDEEARAAAAAPAKAQGGESIGPATILVIFIIFWLLSGVLGGFGRRRGGRGLWWLLPLLLNGGGGGGGRGGGDWGGGGFGGGGFGGGGFGGGGGSGGGGGASGSW